MRRSRPRQRIAAYALLTNNDRLLLCRISNEVPNAAGQWTLPGGGIDYGEHPDEAVMREVREETGFEIALNGVAAIDSEMIIFPDGELHAVRIIYNAEVTGGELRHELDGSTDRCEWLTYEECRRLSLVPLGTRALRLVFEK